LFLAAWLLVTPQDAETHLQAGLALKKTGDVAGAEAQFRQALEADPKLSAAHFYLASVLLDESKPREALEELQSVPLSPAVEHLLGLAYLESGDAEHAVEMFRKHSNDAQTHYYLGIALGQQGHLPAAMREFKSAIAMKPDFGAAHESLGIALRRDGDAAGALKEFQLAARSMPKNPVTLCDLGLALKEAGKWVEAEQALRAALALKPDFERARYALGLVLRMRGENGSATVQMQQVRALHDQRTADAQSRKFVLDGVAALQAGHADDARAAFEKAVALNPSNAEAHMRLGILHARLKENDAALEELSTAVAANGDLPEAHYNLARLLALLGRANEALNELQECLAIDPGQIDARMLVGNLYAERGDVGHAAGAYEEVLRRKPEFAEAHNNLGLVWLNAGKNDLAQKEFRAALKLKPDYAAAQYNLELAEKATPR